MQPTKEPNVLFQIKVPQTLADRIDKAAGDMYLKRTEWSLQAFLYYLAYLEKKDQ